jgi:hypothetical protein
MTPSSMSSQGSGKTPSGSSKAPAVSKLRMQIPLNYEEKQIPPLRRSRLGETAPVGMTILFQYFR